MADTASLTLTGSHAALSAALAAFYDAAGVSGPLVTFGGPAPLPPMPTNPNGAADDDDENAPSGAAPVGGLDSSGMPWDGRIHSANKTTTAAGAWRKVKGVDKALVAQVEAELRQATAPAGDPSVTPPTPLAPPLPVAGPTPIPPMPPVVPMPVAPIAPPPTMAPPAPLAPPVAPVTPPAPMAPPAPVDPNAPLDFNGFMQHMSGLMQTKRDAAGVPLITVEYMTNLAKRISDAYQMPTPLTSITDLMNHSDKIDYARQLVQHDGYWA